MGIYVLLFPVAYLILLLNRKRKLLHVIFVIWLVIWVPMLAISYGRIHGIYTISIAVRTVTIWYTVVTHEVSFLGSLLPLLSDRALSLLDAIWSILTMLLLWVGVRGCRRNANGEAFVTLRIGISVKWPEQELAAWLAAGAPDIETWQEMKEHGPH